MSEKPDRRPPRSIAFVAGDGDGSDEDRELAVELGKAVAEGDFLLLVPAMGDFHVAAAEAARAEGATVVAFSPAEDRDDHFFRWGLPLDSWDILLYTGLGAREVKTLTARSGEGLVILPTERIPLYAMGSAVAARRAVGILGSAKKLKEALETLGGIGIIKRNPHNLIRALGRQLHHVLPEGGDGSDE